MKVFLREISENRLTDEMLAPYQTTDYVLDFQESSVIVWALV